MYCAWHLYESLYLTSLFKIAKRKGIIFNSIFYSCLPNICLGSVKEKYIVFFFLFIIFNLSYSAQFFMSVWMFRHHGQIESLLNSSFCMDKYKNSNNNISYVWLTLECIQSHHRSSRSKACHLRPNEAISSQMNWDIVFTIKQKMFFDLTNSKFKLWGQRLSWKGELVYGLLWFVLQSNKYALESKLVCRGDFGRKRW